MRFFFFAANIVTELDETIMKLDTVEKRRLTAMIIMMSLFEKTTVSMSACGSICLDPRWLFGRRKEAPGSKLPPLSSIIMDDGQSPDEGIN